MIPEVEFENYIQPDSINIIKWFIKCVLTWFDDWLLIFTRRLFFGKNVSEESSTNSSTKKVLFGYIPHFWKFNLRDPFLKDITC